MSLRRLVVLLVLALFASASRPAQAWVYHEHRGIALAAIASLDADAAGRLDALWRDARAGRESRYCAAPAAGDQGLHPACLDFAAWPAIGGDHSCTFEQLLATVGESDWIMKVAEVAAKTEDMLAKAHDARSKNAALAYSTLALAEVDAGLATRAAANNGHFLLTRSGNDGYEYVIECARAGAPLNSVGIYLRHHVAALRIAAAWGDASSTPEARADLARAALAREAFALHFLEDSFAAGHVAGCWGDNAERMGTHDYYNEHGLETMTWGGQNAILLGDGNMRPEDQARVASAVAASLAQLLDATRPDSKLAEAVRKFPLEKALEHPSLDTCAGSTFTEGPKTPLGLYTDLADVLLRTPMPGRGPGIAALPRNRAEIGPFVGFYGAGRVAVLGGAFEAADDRLYRDGSLDVALRGGYGLESLLSQTGDGQLFFQVGVTMHEDYPTRFGPTQSVHTQLTDPAARSGVSVRWRAPFWLIPGDLIVAAPVLAVASPDSLRRMAVRSADGGLIPWQRAIPTDAGRFQFVLGREVGVVFYGYFGTPDEFTLRTTDASGAGVRDVTVQVRSIQWEFPILEYRALRSFATRQSHALVVQIGAGFDRPTRVRVANAPDVPPPELQKRYLAFLRIAFDIRRYL